MNHYKQYADLAATLINSGCHTATKYLSPTHVIRATRVVYNRKIDKRDRRTEILFTDGVPNYHAREFIKRCKKAGEPFPVKKIQLTFFPRRKK